MANKFNVVGSALIALLNGGCPANTPSDNTKSTDSSGDRTKHPSDAESLITNLRTALKSLSVTREDLVKRLDPNMSGEGWSYGPGDWSIASAGIFCAVGVDELDASRRSGILTRRLIQERLEADGHKVTGWNNRDVCEGTVDNNGAICCTASSATIEKNPRR